MLIRQNPMIKSSDIEKMLGLSRKQLNYSMRKINAWLQWEHLPVIQRTKQGGFILNEQASMKLFMQKAEPESGYVYSHEERLQISILILLGMPDVTLNHFVSILEISKNTALSTLKQLQILIRRFNLELRYSREFGYLLTGREFNRRQLLSDALTRLSGEQLRQAVTLLTRAELTFKQDYGHDVWPELESLSLLLCHKALADVFIDG